MQPLFLKIFYQGRLLKVCPFTDDQISIGSGEGLSLKLRGIAPWHVIIEKKWDRYTIFDLGSETGTFINKQKIAGEHTLKSGSVFQIGPYLIQFFVGPPPAVSSPSAVKSTAPLSSEAAPPADKTVSPVIETAPPTEKKVPPLRQAVPPSGQQPPSPQETTLPINKPAPPIEETAVSSESPVPPVEESISPVEESVPSEKEDVFSKEDSDEPFSQGMPESPFTEDKEPDVFDEDAMETSVGIPQRDQESFPQGQVFSKPEGKGFWRTFAPSDKVSSLDEYLEPSVGNLIEVLISWKDRILNSFHFSKKGRVYLGSSKNCEVPVSNLLGLKKYKLLEIDSGAKIFLDHGVKGALIQKKDESSRTVHPLPGNQSLVLRPYEIVRIDFQNLLRVYVRFKSKPSSIVPAGLFNLTFSETAVLFFSFLTTSLLLFYAGLYAPAFLQKQEDFLEKNIIQAVVKFEKKSKPLKPRVVEMKLADKTQARKRKSLVKQKQVKKKKPQIKKPKPVVVQKRKKTKIVPKKTAAIKKAGKKPGKISTVAKGKKRSVKAKVAVGSARPGGSLKTGKSGSTAKTVAPDPTKTGLLGVFGGGGKQAKLDTGATGSTGGGLLGLAETSTGFAGTKEGYEGEGVGTKTKELATGGQGTSLVGIKGIKTKGRGGNLLGKGKGKGGSLGSRGRVNINIGADDIEVEGEIDKAGILRVIRRNRVKFDKCYQFSLQQKSSLAGAIKMEWQILSNGSVRAARPIQDSVGSDSLSNCMRRVLSQLRFPAPPSGQIPKVSFKFVFSI